MFKNKKVMGISVLVVSIVIVLSAGGYALAHSHKQGLTAQETADAAAAQPDSSNSSAGATNTNATATPLTGTTATTNPSSSNTSLRANSSASSGLGQMTTSGQAATSSTGQNQSSSSASNPFDPSTFGQYTSHQNDSSASFADVQMGTGASLDAGKTAAVYYRGWLTNGTLFDQSKTDSTGTMQAFDFTLGSHQVITGWEQGLAGMKVGGVRLLIVPPSVGYGDTAQGSIPANSLLIFQVQLVAVQ